MRLGLVGAGRWGRRYIETIAAVEGLELSWVASRNPKTPEYAPAARVAANWRDLLDDDLDGVIIATPPASHGEILHAFVEAGIPSMVEKPLCLDLDEAYRLRDFVQAREVPVLVDHTQLFHAAFDVLKNRIGDLGPVRYIRSEGMDYSPFRTDVHLLWDRSPHDVALCIDLLRTPPERVSALGGEHSVTLSLEFNGGVAAWIANSNVSVEKRRALAVHLENRVFVLDDLSSHQLIEHQLDHTSCGPLISAVPGILPVPQGLPLTRALEHFVNGIGTSDREGFGLDLACHVIATLDAAQRSLGTREPQPLRGPLS